MQELEPQIAAWRKKMSAALPGQDETVRELESHLRDHIEAQTRRGVPVAEALAQGVARIGEPRALASEFSRVGEPWYAARPVVVVYVLFGAALALLAAVMIRGWAGGLFPGLLVVHVVAITTGYLAMLAAGLIGFWTLTSGWLFAPTERDMAAQRRAMFKLTVLGSVTTPVGMALGAVWAAQVSSHAWSWAPVEVGALCVLISTWLLLVAHFRVVWEARVLSAVLAILGASVVGAGWLVAGALTAPVPVAWLCGAAIIAQGGLVLLHERAKQRGRDERVRLARE
jgi:hypothetical protein